MKIEGKPYRTIWQDPQSPSTVSIIDQRLLPFRFEIISLQSVADTYHAIRDMAVRGAGCIGATAGYGMYLAAVAHPEKDSLVKAGDYLKSSRPTAVNLAWAVERQLEAIGDSDGDTAIAIALETANAIADEDAEWCRRIGQHGLPLIQEISGKKQGEPVNILTHCNAGWLAFVDHGSATAPIYAAHDAGIPVHVWVDETRPRNQGARLTAWELAQHGVPHTLIADNTGGHLMQHGMVDLCITGTDRTTHTGDVANKIGTYLKALAAKDNNIPFYVALPSSTFDWETKDGVAEIPIEERDGDEVTKIEGIDSAGKVSEVKITPEGTPTSNYAFDVTASRLITGLITERGICGASETEIHQLFPEM